MVGLGEDPLGGEPGGKLLGLLPRDAVDDRRFATVAAESRERLRDPVGAGDDAVAEVWPVECSEEHPRRAEVELGGDVGPDTRRGGGREGVNACCGEAVAEEGQLPVFGAEVVAPLADAVGLVDRESLHADAGEEVEEPAVDEPLRRREQEPQFPGSEPIADVRSLLLGHLRVERSRGVADRLEGVDLIFHQCHQRRDDDVGGLTDQRR